jgi:DNA-binding MarR family transcriptional regulator
MKSTLHRRRYRGSSEERAILDDLRRLVRVLRLSAKEAQRRLGISGAQLFLLELLARVGASSLGELAEAAQTDQSTASVVVSRLVARGLVSRTRSASDGRRVELALTPSGNALLARAPEPAQALLMRALALLPPKGRRSLATNLDALVHLMGASAPVPPLFFEEPSHGRRHARS